MLNNDLELPILSLCDRSWNKGIKNDAWNGKAGKGQWTNIEIGKSLKIVIVKIVIKQ